MFSLFYVWNFGERGNRKVCSQKRKIAYLWNSLSGHIKTAENLEIFKRLIKTWEGPRPICNCNFCKHVKDDTEFGSFITKRIATN